MITDAELEQYYQKGGYYLIPSEIVNQMTGNWNSLIKYLEVKLKENQTLVCAHQERNIQDIYLAKVESFQYVLDRIRSGKYD